MKKSESKTKEQLDKFNSRITKAKEDVENIFHYAEKYSSLENKRIAINVKMYNMDYPTTEEVQNALFEKGYSEESVEALITDDFMYTDMQMYLEGAWETLVDTGTSEVKLVGNMGRSSGYAVFEVEFLGLLAEDKDYSDMTAEELNDADIDIERDGIMDKDGLKRFSGWIEERYNNIVKGKTLEEVIQSAVDLGQLETEEEAVKRIEEEKIEALRGFTTEARATKEFAMTGRAYVTLWGEDRLPKERLSECGFDMDTALFEAEELTIKVIFENLNDGGFGVQNIEGGEVLVRQKLDITKTYTDNGEVTKYPVWVNALEWVEVTDKDDEEAVSKNLTKEYMSPFVQDRTDKNKEKRESKNNEDSPKNPEPTPVKR